MLPQYILVVSIVFLHYPQNPYITPQIHVGFRSCLGPGVLVEAQFLVTAGIVAGHEFVFSILYATAFCATATVAIAIRVLILLMPFALPTATHFPMLLQLVITILFPFLAILAATCWGCFGFGRGILLCHGRSGLLPIAAGIRQSCSHNCSK